MIRWSYVNYIGYQEVMRCGEHLKRGWYDVHPPQDLASREISLAFVAASVFDRTKSFSRLCKFSEHHLHDTSEGGEECVRFPLRTKIFSISCDCFGESVSLSGTLGPASGFYCPKFSLNVVEQISPNTLQESACELQNRFNRNLSYQHP